MQKTRDELGVAASTQPKDEVDFLQGEIGAVLGQTYHADGRRGDLLHDTLLKLLIIVVRL